MADLPECPNARQGTCERSDPQLAGESEDWISVRCRTCKAVYVVTLPEGRARAVYDNWIESQKKNEAAERARGSRPLIFT